MLKKKVFAKIAKVTSREAGEASTFFVAVGMVIIWIMTGPIFNWSDTWQLVINTGTTIITFLMVFLLQNTQNRDSEALQIKINELIRVTKARNTLLNIEELSQEELDKIKEKFLKIARTAEKNTPKEELPGG